jgi:VanZ family protein
MGMSRANTITFRLALVTALIVILHLATTPQDYPVVKDINSYVNHFMAFCVLALLCDFSFPKNKFGIAKILPLFGYGILIECIHYFLPYREFSLLDLVVDSIGIAVYAFSIPALKQVPLFQRRWDVEG